MSISEAAILDALRAVREPELPGDIVSRDMVRGLAIDGARVAFTIELTTRLAHSRMRSKPTSIVSLPRWAWRLST